MCLRSVFPDILVLTFANFLQMVGRTRMRRIKAQPVLNVIAEPPLAAEGGEFTDAFGDVSAVAAELVRHAGERQEALDKGVGAMLGSHAPISRSAMGARPLALLDRTSASVSGGDTPVLHSQPPAQSDQDVLMELDGVMQAEEAKRKLADDIFAGDKQRMLDVEKAELRRIIREVFA